MAGGAACTVDAVGGQEGVGEELGGYEFGVAVVAGVGVGHGASEHPRGHGVVEAVVVEYTEVAVEGGGP